MSFNDIDEKRYSARVAYSGEATITGTYTNNKRDEEMAGCQIRFELDKESAARLPREKSDTRVPWLAFKNHDEAERLLGPAGSSGKATVVIDEYGINQTYSCEYNTARLVRVVKKESTPQETRPPCPYHPPVPS